MEEDLNRLRMKIIDVWKECDELAMKYKEDNPKMSAIFSSLSASCFHNVTMLLQFIIHKLYN